MSRALVLGGGGPVGIAWETGLVVGLSRAGIDVSDADLVVGTSAGSVVGARLALGHDLAAAAEEEYARPPQATPADTSTAPADDAGRSARGPAAGSMVGLMAAMEEAAAHDGTPEESRAIIGRFALEASTAPEAAFLGWFADLADEDFPAAYACTAVEAPTGAFVVWDRSRGVPLQAAVASSCSVPGIFPPITIDGSRYVDGGMRSGLNADLAAGHELVVVVSCMASSMPGVEDPRMARMRAQREAEESAVTEAGGAVHRIDPGPRFLEVSGKGMYLMDPTRTPDAYEAGLDQATTEAERLGHLWA